MKKYKIQQIITIEDNDKYTKETIKQYLIDNGYKIHKQETYFYDKYGKKRFSNIDIYAWKENKTLAIEVDNKSPRKRTLKKLGNVKADHKVIILRGFGVNYNIGSVKVIYLELNKYMPDGQ